MCIFFSQERLKATAIIVRKVSGKFDLRCDPRTLDASLQGRIDMSYETKANLAVEVPAKFGQDGCRLKKVLWRATGSIDPDSFMSSKIKKTVEERAVAGKVFTVKGAGVHDLEDITIA